MAQARAQPDDAAASVVTCTDVNQASGAILVTRTAKNPNLCAGPHPLAGTTFMVNGCPGNRCQRAGLLRRAHRWDGVHRDREAAPAGTSIDTTFKSVTPTSPDSRMSGTPDRVCFTDSPLTDVLAKATSEVPGSTNPTIACVDYRSSNIGDTPQGPTDSAQVTSQAPTPAQSSSTRALGGHQTKGRPVAAPFVSFLPATRRGYVLRYR